ncbi:MAG: hypothetical protein HXY34_09595 [Candidatus Thorarchaeota archaeon]|nr:hypothetical protein [Candidatus Thorarchaeota archaeon]
MEVLHLKTRLTQSKKGRSLLLTFHEGFSTYTITLPMPYAVRFFAEGLVSSLEMLHEQSDVRKELASKDGEKAFIQEMIRKAAGLLERLLKCEQE